MLGLAIGGLLAMAMGVGRFVYTPLLPFMEEALGIGKSDAGLLASTNYLGYMVGALLAASPWIPGSRRMWVLVGLLTSAASTALMGLADGFAAFLLLRFAGGVASAFVLVFCSALAVTRLTLAGQARYTSVHFAGVGSGIALSAVLVSGLPVLGADWRTLWIAAGAVSLAAVVPVALLVRGDAGQPDKTTTTTRPRSGIRAFRKHKPSLR